MTNDLKANVVHTDLNPCGGAEKLAITTIQALIEMGVDVELTTARAPDLPKLRYVFGSSKIDSIFNSVRKINLINGLSACKNRFDPDTITINTHGDMLPYYLPHFSPRNALTYCHYPVAIDLIEQQNPFYLNYLASLGLVKLDAQNDNPAITCKPESTVWRNLQDSYLMMLRHSTVITNSTFSKAAIRKVLKSTGSDNAEPAIIPPPVRVKELRNAALHSKERQDFIIVISRFNPSKKLENAIALAHILKKQNIGKGMIIAGGLMPEDLPYYKTIENVIKSSDVSDYVRLEVDVTNEMLESILCKGKVYFHPMPDEPFGISIAEAMSAGLIPIVPTTGGFTDFVPEKYRFSSLEDAAYKVFLALNAPQEERKAVSDTVAVFGEASYVKSIQNEVRKLLVQQEEAEMKLKAATVQHRSTAMA